MSKGKRGKSRPTHGVGDRKPAHPVAGSPDYLVLALASAGALIAAYLLIVAGSGTLPAFCAAGSSCDLIQNSRFSRLLGAPIALWGLLLYLVIALVAWRMPARLKRWRVLWGLSWLGLAISLYLTVAGAVALDAFCLWCLVSFAIMVGIFAAVVVRRPSLAPGVPWRNWLSSSVIAAITVVVALQIVHSGLLQGREDPRVSALATHLDETGARFYGAFWCPTCQEQKRLFGASAERLPYVECTPSGRNGPVAMACVAADVSGYPTWVIRGQRYQEVLPVDRLERLSGFRWQPPED